MPHSPSFPPNPLQKLIAQRVVATRKRLDDRRFGDERPLVVFGTQVVDLSVPVSHAETLGFQQVIPGESFGAAGGNWQHRFFKLGIPRAGRGEQGRRVLWWRCQGETTVYLDGVPWAGLDVGHDYCPLPDEECTLYLDTGTYQTGIWVGKTGISDYAGCRFESAGIRLRDDRWWKASWDFAVLADVLIHRLESLGFAVPRGAGYTPPLPPLAPSLRRFLHLMDRACDLVDRDELPALEEHLESIFAEYPASDADGRMTFLGHAHIDLVWLWPEEVTYYKGIHTFSTALRLLERYPEYVFQHASPFLYRKLARRSPELMEEVSRRIREGRWELTGGFDLEADVTLPSGEALARSLLFGQAHFEELTGRRSRLVWIPDVFGYSACLPQMMKQAGIDYFYTTKLTWSSVTRFPYSSFQWRGNDGSTVLAHLCPTGYNGQVQIGEVAEAVGSNLQSHLHADLILPVGHGDGGGGTTEEMIERARRLSGLSGLPRARWASAEQFFRELEPVTARLPVYEGELYLEYHRGVATSQSETKRLYRSAELAMFALESARALRGGPAPGAEEWDRLLLAHFHDALPGSSIALVHRQLEAGIETSRAESEDALAATLGEPGGPAAIFNPLPLPRRQLLELRMGSRASDAVLASGTTMQALGEGRYLALVEVPPHAVAVLKPAAKEASDGGAVTYPVADSVEAGPEGMANGLLSCRFSGSQGLTAITCGDRDLALLSSTFVLYDDYPANFDAWDIDRGSLALGRTVTGLSEPRLVAQGPLRGVIEQSADIGRSSHLLVRYILDAASDWLQIEVEVEWQETHTLLKHHLVFDNRGGDALFGAPFTSVRRSRKPGPEADEARWESTAQRWIALEDDAGTEGIAVVTEAKYGFSVRDGDVGLSLLRSPTSPDPDTDRGRHLIRYAVGPYRRSRTLMGDTPSIKAETLYGPLFVLDAARPAAGPLRIVEPGSLTPVCPKPRRDGAGLIFRLHETAGRGGEASLVLANGYRVRECNILEEAGRPLATDEGGLVSLSYRPHQIVSLLVEPAHEAAT